MPLVKLTDNISYLPASMHPFSADVVIIKTDKRSWLYDVGMGTTALEEIKKIQGPVNVVLSHFHPDHLANLPKIEYENLYVSKYTKRYTFTGQVVESDIHFQEIPEISIINMPSSHAKGCLALVCGDYAFLGDAAYAKEKIGAHSYNAQLLYEMIRKMETLPVKYICMSHDSRFAIAKETVLTLYKDIYKRLEPGNPVISVEDYFNADGSVKQ